MTAYNADHSDLHVDPLRKAVIARSRHALTKQDYIENKADRLAAEDAERQRMEVLALQGQLRAIALIIQDAIADFWRGIWQRKPADIS